MAKIELTYKEMDALLAGCVADVRAARPDDDASQTFGVAVQYRGKALRISSVYRSDAARARALGIRECDLA